jgi:hypothetical protein
MQKMQSQISGRMNRTGSDRLFLAFFAALGVMALVIMHYSGSYESLMPWKGSELNRYVAPDAKPWEEDRLIWGGGPLEGYDMSAKRPPFASQPKIANRLTYEVKLADGDKPMGTLTASVLSNFDALASWKGEFEIDGRRYTADLWEDKFTKHSLNAFSGNIYPCKIYKDSKGEDRKKLYFITKGYYQLRGAEKGDVREGTAYINGWVSKDFSAEGTLSIPHFDKDKDLILKWGPVSPKKQ